MCVAVPELAGVPRLCSANPPRDFLFWLAHSALDADSWVVRIVLAEEGAFATEVHVEEAHTSAIIAKILNFIEDLHAPGRSHVDGVGHSDGGYQKFREDQAHPNSVKLDNEFDWRRRAYRAERNDRSIRGGSVDIIVFNVDFWDGDVIKAVFDPFVILRVVGGLFCCFGRFGTLATCCLSERTAVHLRCCCIDSL